MTTSSALYDKIFRCDGEANMLITKPVSILKNQFEEIELEVNSSNHVVLLKDGRPSMVIMSISEFESLSNDAEDYLDEADLLSEQSSIRLTHDEVFGSLRK